MPLFSCKICGKSRSPLRPLCQACAQLFDIVRKSAGSVGLSELIDRLIATGVEKSHVKIFLESNKHGQGSMLDQITAALTNNLAQGIGVKEKDMTARDVMQIRENPAGVASHKPLDD